jgi:hypothetical protein
LLQGSPIAVAIPNFDFAIIITKPIIITAKLAVVITAITNAITTATAVATTTNSLVVIAAIMACC